MQEMALILECDRKLVEAQVKVIQDRTTNLTVQQSSTYFMNCLNYAGDGHGAGR
jgi:hypothetical protein